MATNLIVKVASKASEIYSYMANNDINQADTFVMYYDAGSNSHVLWHTAPADVTGPILSHTNIANGKTRGVAVPVYVNCGDFAQLERLELFCRTTGAPGYATIAFQNLGEGVFKAFIPATTVQNPSVDYYIEGEDANANTTSLGNAGAPIQFTVP